MLKSLKSYGLKYLRIYEDIKEKIISGHLKPDVQLLPFRQLMEFYGSSYRTVAQALEELEKYNLITRTQGRGIFVTPKSRWNIEVDKSKFIGLIVTDMIIPFFGRIIQVVESELGSIGYNVVVRNSEFDSNTEKLIVNEFVDSGFHGILIVPTFDEKNTEYLQKLEQKAFPLFYLNRYKHGYECNYVVPDDYAGVQEAMNYLYDMGHRKIGYICGEKIKGKDFRFTSYSDFIKQKNLPLRQEWIVYGPFFEIESGYRCMKEILACKDLPTAVFCYSDSMAAGAMKACREKGLKLPKDVSFVGCNDDDISRIVEPNLTTLLDPIETIAKLSTRSLIERIKDKSTLGEPLQLRVPMKLLVRDSVRRIY
jgi:DNA-binding LacI/PurR family transcriptional regulator